MWDPPQTDILRVPQLSFCSTPSRMPPISYLVLLSAVDAASLPTPLGVAVYLALVAGFRGEQVVFILFLRGRKVGAFPKTQARNTVSGGRKAERPISDSCFKMEILPFPSEVLHVAPTNTWKITPGYWTGMAWTQDMSEEYQATSCLDSGLTSLPPGLDRPAEHLL